MKALLIILSVICLTMFFVQVASAEDRQNLFSPSDQVLVFLNCFSSDKNIIARYEAIQSQMASKWQELKIEGVNILFSAEEPYTKKIIKVYVGGILGQNGRFVSLPHSVFISLYEDDMASELLMNINDEGKIIHEVKRLAEE